MSHLARLRLEYRTDWGGVWVDFSLWELSSSCYYLVASRQFGRGPKSMPVNKKRVARKLVFCVFVPITATALAFLVRAAMVRRLGEGFPPYVTFYPTVMVVSLAFGLGSGLVASASSALLAAYWILPPQGTFKIEGPSDVIGLLFFLGTSVLMSLTAEYYRRNRKRAEDSERELARRANEAQFRTLADAIPQLCWIADAQGWISWYNQRWYDYTGTTPQQMEGWGRQSVHDPEVLPKVLERWKASLATAEPFDMVFPLRGADGIFRPFLTRIMPVREESGQVVRWFGTNTDISEQLRTEEELKYQLALNQRIAGGAPVSIVVIDGEGQVTFVNPEAERVFGYSQDEMLGKSFHHLVHHHADGRPIAVEECQLFMSCLSGDTVRDYEDVFYRKDGGAINVSCSVGPLTLDGSPPRSVLLIRNITERKRAMDELHANQAKLEAALAAMTDAVFISDSEGQFLEFNDAFATFHRFQKKADCARALAEYPDILEVFTADGKPAPMEMWAVPRALRGETVVNAEYGLRRKDTGETWIGSYSFAPIRNQDSAIIGAVVTARDITESKRAAEALLQNKERLESFIKHAPVALAMFDRHMRYLQFSDRWLVDTGLGNKDIWGKSHYEVFPSMPRHWKQIHRRGLDGERLKAEEDWVAGDGKTHSIRWEIHPWGDSGTATGGIIISFDDTTEHKRAKAALEASEERFRRLVEASPVAIFVNRNGRIDFANPAANYLFGASTPEQLYGKTPFDLFHPDYHPLIRDRIADMNLGGIAPLIEEKIIRMDGEVRDVEVAATPFLDKAGWAIQVTLNDITERKKAELALAQKAEELARSNAELEQFAYVASHDLQEPLRSIAGFSQLLAKRYRGKLDQDADDFIEYIVEGAIRMQALIQGLLTYSRLGTRGGDFASIDSADSLRSALSNLQRVILKTEAVIAYDDLPTVHADGIQLTQLFQNLIGNAIKFQPPDRRPEIKISAEWVREEWRFAVKDNGIGIAPKHQERVFLIFQRLNARSEYPGTGIGLAICKRIVERHGGRIWVASQLGEGATFYFTMPGERGTHE